MTKTLCYPQKADIEWPFCYPEYMRPPLAANYTGRSESSLAKLRMTHNREKGPRFIKQGGVVLYRRVDLDAWLESHFVGGED